MAKKIQFAPCPCGLDINATYTECCGRWVEHGNAPDPVSLMRSRYTAFTQKNAAYLLATWHPSTRPSELDLSADDCKWLGLDIKATSTPTDSVGEVEFVARYKISGRAFRLHERSQFVREEGRWFYVKGEIEP